MILFRVPETKQTLQVKDFLRKTCGLSLTEWRKIKRADSLEINGTHVCPGRALVQAGDVITYRLYTDETKTKMEPIKLPLSIVYEDGDLLVVEKPAGMLVHPTTTQRCNTLANAVLYYYQTTKQILTYHPVHRLDKNTSGLLLIAKYPHIQHKFTNQLEKKFFRSYTAITHGILANKSGTISAPIARHPDSIIERIVDITGKKAITHYTVLKTYQKASKVQLQLETGRTHQIRVHLAYLGHPIIGDDLYGGSREHIFRQALHASCLSFTHPMTKKDLVFTSEIPSDMLELTKTISS